MVRRLSQPEGPQLKNSSKSRLYLRTGNSHSTPCLWVRFDGYTSLMRISRPCIALALLPFFGGCGRHMLTDYRPADQAGIYSGTIEDLKKLNTSDAEVAEIIRLKKANIDEKTIVSLVRIAHEHQHSFVATDTVESLAGANLSDDQILRIAQTDQYETIGNDVVMLHVMGLSAPTVDYLLDRRLKGVRTMSVATIADLKNSGISEKDILYRIQQGMTDAQGEAEAAARQRATAHNTGFKSNRGRRR